MTQTHTRELEQHLNRMAEMRAYKNLIEALSDSNPPLARRMKKCGRDDIWAGNIFTCRTTGCPACKGRYRWTQQQKMVEVFGAAEKRYLSFATVMLDITGPIQDIRDIWTKGKTALRNRIKALARNQRRWKNIQISGWLEADAVTYDMVPLLGSQQQSYIRSLNPVLGDSPAWVVHLHAIIHHPDIDWQAVRDELRVQWPIPRAVDIQPSDQAKYAWQDAGQAAFYMTQYAVKFRAGRLLGNPALGPDSYCQDYWPAPWLADYHSQLSTFSRGHQGTRVTIGLPREKPSIISDRQSIEYLIDDHDNDDCYGFVL